MSANRYKAPLEIDYASHGSVLILVLIVLSSLVSLTVGLAYRTRIEVRLVQAMAERTRAFHLALGGIERTKALLGQSELSAQAIGAVGSFSETAGHEDLFEQVDSFQVGRMHLGYMIRDERGYLHLNKSNPAGWENVSGLDRGHIASMLDWMDADDAATLDGAESEFYTRAEPPYVAKNRPCMALRELLFVRDVDYCHYVGDGGIWDVMGEEDRDGQTAGSDSEGNGPVNSGFANIFTVYGDGAININTVGREILSSLPGLDEQAVEAIVSRRNGPDGILGTEDDKPLASAEDLAQVENLSALHVDLLSQYCCWTSTFFRVSSVATSDRGCVCGVMASIRVVDGQPRVLCMERLF